MLQILVSDESVIERYPTPEISERCAHLAESLRGDTVRITSELGTDLTVRRGERPVHCQDGAVTFPGDWDSLGVVVCAFAPVETEANGVVVVNGPIYASPDFRFHLSMPLKLIFEHGRVVDIQGEGSELTRLCSYLDDVKDPNAYVIAHTGFGMDPRARIMGVTDVGNWESYDAGINIAIGANNIPQLHGQTACKSHVDMFVLGASMTVDDKSVIQGGTFIN